MTELNESKIAAFDGFMGQSLGFKSMVNIIQQAAVHDVPVLIEGEAGTEKEWLARSIHFASKRVQGEFVVLDCSSFSDFLLESELFGYVRGSFAGAIYDKKGLLELAHQGTLFLDHLEHMNLAAQGKLLRYLKESSFLKVGGVSWKKADIRLICASQDDLKSLVSEKKLREDLYYQLSVLRITIPPLRERQEDIMFLANFFLKKMLAQGQRKEFSREIEELFESYVWPGNFHEFEK